MDCNLTQNIYHMAIESFASGLFGVIGGAIPIAFIILIFFYITRQNFRKVLPDEQKILEKLKEALKKEKDNLEKIEAKEVTITKGLEQDFLAYKIDRRQKVLDYELQIIKQEAWINKVQNSSLLKWVIYRVSSHYFKDYFKK